MLCSHSLVSRFAVALTHVSSWWARLEDCKEQRQAGALDDVAFNSLP